MADISNRVGGPHVNYEALKKTPKKKEPLLALLEKIGEGFAAITGMSKNSYTSTNYRYEDYQKPHSFPEDTVNHDELVRDMASAIAYHQLIDGKGDNDK